VKRKAFLLSILLHLIGGLLIIRLPMTVQLVSLPRSVITVVPMSPPPAEPAPRLIAPPVPRRAPPPSPARRPVSPPPEKRAAPPAKPPQFHLSKERPVPVPEPSPRRAVPPPKPPPVVRPPKQEPPPSRPVRPVKPPPAARTPVTVRPFVIPPGHGGEAAASRTEGGNPASSSVTGAEGAHAPPAAGAGLSPADLAPPRPGRLTIDREALDKKLQELHAGTPGPQSLAEVPFHQGSPGSATGRPGGGNQATAGAAFFDAKGYDITPWAQRAVYRVKQNWIVPPYSNLGMTETVGIYVVFGRDGKCRDLMVKKSSGIKPLDQAAWNALVLSIPFQELPADFPNPDLPAYFLFRYN